MAFSWWLHSSHTLFNALLKSELKGFKGLHMKGIIVPAWLGSASLVSLIALSDTYEVIKRYCLVVIGSTMIAGACFAQDSRGGRGDSTPTSYPGATPEYSPVERGPHHTVWRRTSWETTPLGERRGPRDLFK